MERIASLVHALPAKEVTVEIANGPGSERAVAFFEETKRAYRIVPAPAEPRPSRLWEPSPGLVQVLPSLPAGHALDLGCGTGRDAVFLALNGWQVTAVDVLPDALERVHSLAELHGVKVETLALDVDREPLPAGPFDLVCAFRFLPDLEKMASVVAPLGSMVVETFTDGERARTGKPKDARLVLPSAGPPPLPEGLAVQDYQVREIGGRELAVLWAVRTEG